MKNLNIGEMLKPAGSGKAQALQPKNSPGKKGQAFARLIQNSAVSVKKQSAAPGGARQMAHIKIKANSGTLLAPAKGKAPDLGSASGALKKSLIKKNPQAKAGGTAPETGPTFVAANVPGSLKQFIRDVAASGADMKALSSDNRKMLFSMVKTLESTLTGQKSGSAAGGKSVSASFTMMEKGTDRPVRMEKSGDVIRLVAPAELRTSLNRMKPALKQMLQKYFKPAGDSNAGPLKLKISYKENMPEAEETASRQKSGKGRPSVKGGVAPPAPSADKKGHTASVPDKGGRAPASGGKETTGTPSASASSTGIKLKGTPASVKDGVASPASSADKKGQSASVADKAGRAPASVGKGTTGTPDASASSTGIKLKGTVAPVKDRVAPASSADKKGQSASVPDKAARTPASVGKETTETPGTTASSTGIKLKGTAAPVKDGVSPLAPSVDKKGKSASVPDKDGRTPASVGKETTGTPSASASTTGRKVKGENGVSVKGAVASAGEKNTTVRERGKAMPKTETAVADEFKADKKNRTPLKAEMRPMPEQKQMLEKKESPVVTAKKTPPGAEKQLREAAPSEKGGPGERVSLKDGPKEFTNESVKKRTPLSAKGAFAAQKTEVPINEASATRERTDIKADQARLSAGEEAKSGGAAEKTLSASTPVKEAAVKKSVSEKAGAKAASPQKTDVSGDEMTEKTTRLTPEKSGARPLNADEARMSASHRENARVTPSRVSESRPAQGAATAEKNADTPKNSSGENSGNAFKESSPSANTQRVEHTSPDENGKVDFTRHMREAVRDVHPASGGQRTQPPLKTQNLVDIIARHRNRVLGNQRMIVDGGALGDLDVRIEEQARGKALHIYVDNESARQEVQKMAPAILNGLQARDIPLTGVVVDYDKNRDGQKGPRQKPQEKNITINKKEEENEEHSSHIRSPRKYGYNTVEFVA